MKVVEIFNSIEGEGIRAGLPCTFIRLHGCNLNCSYCDSRYACEGDEYSEWEIDEIVSQVQLVGCPYVTLTGGEPLIHDEVPELLSKLSRAGFQVNIETNGSVDLKKFLDAMNEYFWEMPFFFTMDWKCLSSNMSSKMIEDNLKVLYETDVLKFVVGCREDLIQMKDFLNSHSIRTSNIYVSPVFGKIEPSDIVEFLKHEKMWNVRLQLQMHKFVWPADMRGV